MVEGEKVVCWGSDGFGQMDDESPYPTGWPVTPLGLQGEMVQIVQSGGHHSCVLDMILRLRVGALTITARAARAMNIYRLRSPTKAVSRQTSLFNRVFTAPYMRCD